MPGSRLCQLGVSSRRESQRSLRHEFATSPRSSTTWSSDNSVRKWLAARPEWPAPMTTAVKRSGDLDGDLRRIRERVEHRGALLGLGHQRLDLLLRGVRVDLERHLDVVEAVPDVAVDAEDSA